MDSHDLGLSRASVTASEYTCAPTVAAEPLQGGLRAYVRDALACHPLRVVLAADGSTAPFSDLAASWEGRRTGTAAQVHQGDSAASLDTALTSFAHAVLLRARTEALGARATPARVLQLLNKMGLPSHGILTGGASAAQARTALALTILQPAHVWNVLEHLPADQRVEFHTLVLFTARSLEAMWV